MPKVLMAKLLAGEISFEPVEARGGGLRRRVFQPAVIGLDRVVRVLTAVVLDVSQRVIDDAEQRRGEIGRDLGAGRGRGSRGRRTSWLRRCRGSARP